MACLLIQTPPPNIKSSHLNDCTQILQKYYHAKGHQKRQLSVGGRKLQDLKRDLHGFIATKANVSVEPGVSDGGETLLLEEVAINILQLTC